MKQLFTFLLFFLGITQLAKAQYVSYETQSKWIFGFNVGGTWSTTDVKYKTYGGWGMTLGRSFNYDYGRRLSFDIRGRYSGGTWYGQSFDTTDLTNYGGTTLLPYKDSLGFSVNNFQATVHELSLELVLHANGLRERTKLDPYIFGGIGLTWHQTYGDLRMNDTLGEIYNYDPTALSKSYVNSLIDQIYETELDGTVKNQFRVGIMPSIGFGIGYQVAPRVTIGLEHKSTFTQLDNFDGFVRESKYKQDIYHYTSGFVQVRLKARNERTTPNPTETATSATSQSATTSTECLSPVINIIQPASSGLSSGNISYTVIASVANVENRQNIVFKVNGVSNLNYTFNPQTDRFESNVVLNQGANTFELSATNACGNASQSSTISYTQCVLPVLTRISPVSTETSVSNPAYSLALNAQHISNASEITMTVNNRSWTGFSYNASTGQINGSITLQPGQNVFVVKATNACGTVSETFTINYQQCVAPAISVLVPTGPTPTVTQASYAFSASVQHVASQQGVKVKFNNQMLSGITYSAATGSLNGTVTLVPGTNTFEISAANECGSDVETFTVNYQNCVPPVTSMVSPSTSGTTVNTAAFTLSCVIQNAAQQGITVTHNNRSIVNFSYNASTGNVQSALTLLPGLNTFVVTSTNACGTDTETITINFLDCVAPNITLLNPATSGTSVTTATYLFKATIFNAGSAQNIVLKQNGAVISGVNFNASTNQVQAFLTLTGGTNTIVLSASNACGMDAETTTINYNDCVAPVLTVTNPVNSGSTVTQASFSLSGTVTGLSAVQQLQVLQNGQPLGSNINLNGNTFGTNATLTPGTNTFVIKAMNACGTDTKTIIVQYNNCTPPVITLVSPLSGATSTSGSVQINAQITNANGNTPTVMVNNRSILLAGYNPTNGSLQMNVPLIPGQNTITISVTNACGTDTETINVFYDNCVPPVITVTSPINGSVTTSNTVQINAQVANANGSAPTLTVNNRSILLTGYNASTGALQMSVPLIAGQNTITITVTNACGSDTETITVVYQQEQQKIKICHYTSGNTGTPQTIEILASEWPAHEAHGDKLGPCPELTPTNGGGQGSGLINNSGGLGGHSGTQGTGGTTGTSGSGSVSTDGISNGNSVGTGVGRPGGSGTATDGSSGSSGSGTGTTTTGGNANGNSMGTGTGRPGSGTTNTGSGSGTGTNPPAPVANPGNSSNGGSGGGTGGTGNKGTTTPTPNKKAGTTKPGQQQKTEENNQDSTTPPPTEKKPDEKQGAEQDKSGGGK